MVLHSHVAFYVLYVLYVLMFMLMFMLMFIPIDSIPIHRQKTEQDFIISEEYISPP